jgi:hypothetical protein
MSLKTALMRINCYPCRYHLACTGEFVERLLKSSDPKDLPMILPSIIQQAYDQGVADGKREAGKILSDLLMKGS